MGFGKVYFCLSVVDAVKFKLSDCQIIITCCWIHYFPPAPRGISAALSLRTHAAVIRNACKKVVEMLDSHKELQRVFPLRNVRYSDSAQMLRPKEFSHPSLSSIQYYIEPLFYRENWV